MATKVIVKQIRSTIGHPKNQLRTLKALGLGRIGRSREVTLSESTKGMIRTVQHLVQVVEA